RLAGGKDIADPAGECRRVRKIPHRTMSAREKYRPVIVKAHLFHRWCRLYRGLRFWISAEPAVLADLRRAPFGTARIERHRAARRRRDVGHKAGIPDGIV